MSRRKFLCMDCGVDTGKIHEHYMLADSVWALVHTSPRGMLCIGCVEKKLGRQLVSADFVDAYINHSRTAPQSKRLRDRLDSPGGI